LPVRHDDHLESQAGVGLREVPAVECGHLVHIPDMAQNLGALGEGNVAIAEFIRDHACDQAVAMLSPLPEQVKITDMEQVKNPGDEPHNARHRAPIYFVSGKAYGNGDSAESSDFSLALATVTFP